MSEPTPADFETVLAQTLALIDVQPRADDPNTSIGTTPDWFGDYVFGGVVIAQAIGAATRSAPEGTRLHSLHAYFLRPVMAEKEIVYTFRPLREGRSFTAHQLEAVQDSKPVLTMSYSFTADTDGYVYDLLGAEVPPPLDAMTIEPGPGPWVAADAGPTPPAADGTRTSTHRMWFRIPARLSDDSSVHTALLGFATDWTGIGGRPLHLEGDTQGMVSLDHAAWFHRPARADEWLFYDVHALVNAGGRGLLRGVMRDEHGRIVISVAQEMRLTPVDQL